MSCPYGYCPVYHMFIVIIQFYQTLIITQLDQVFIVNIPHVVPFFLSTYVSGLSHLGHVSVVNVQSEQVPVSLLQSFVLTGNQAL